MTGTFKINESFLIVVFFSELMSFLRVSMYFAINKPK